MALNRLIDADIDARNPRTAARELPSGRLTADPGDRASALVSLAVLLVAVSPAPGEHLVPLADPGRRVRALPLRQARHLALPPGARPHDRPRADGGLAGGDRATSGRRRPARARRWPAGSPASTSSTRCWTWTSTAPTASTRSPARFGPARALWFTRGAAPRGGRPAGRRPGSPPARGPLYIVGVARAARWCCCTRTRSSPRGDTGAWPRRVRAVERPPRGGLPRLRPGRGDALGRSSSGARTGQALSATGRALDRVDVDVAEGECLAVLGPNGAGKSTLLRMLATLLRPDEGAPSASAGTRCPQRARRARAAIGYLGHDPLRLPRPDRAAEPGALRRPLRRCRDPGSASTTCSTGVGLLARSFDPVRTFSRGMAQRLGLARALLHEPSLLLLDEPYAGPRRGRRAPAGRRARPRRARDRGRRAWSPTRSSAAWPWRGGCWCCAPAGSCWQGHRAGLDGGRVPRAVRGAGRRERGRPGRPPAARAAAEGPAPGAPHARHRRGDDPLRRRGDGDLPVRLRHPRRRPHAASPGASCGRRSRSPRCSAWGARGCPSASSGCSTGSCSAPGARAWC